MMKILEPVSELLRPIKLGFWTKCPTDCEPNAHSARRYIFLFFSKSSKVVLKIDYCSALNMLSKDFSHFRINAISILVFFCLQSKKT